VVGTPEQVTEQLLVAVEQGASMVTVHFHDVPRPDGTMLFAQEVLPHLRNA
jgi:alkanesulfonate monooxygenase SsuD/methylene tetrahydromethanopterin reductase-like flavin-dependent oxidoreductase (luciferase family)